MNFQQQQGLRYMSTEYNIVNYTCKQVLGQMALIKIVKWVIYKRFSMATDFGSYGSYINCQLSNL